MRSTIITFAQIARMTSTWLLVRASHYREFAKVLDCKTRSKWVPEFATVTPTICIFDYYPRCGAELNVAPSHGYHRVANICWVPRAPVTGLLPPIKL